MSRDNNSISQGWQWATNLVTISCLLSTATLGRSKELSTYNGNQYVPHRHPLSLIKLYTRTYEIIFLILSRGETTKHWNRPMCFFLFWLLLNSWMKDFSLLLLTDWLAMCFLLDFSASQIFRNRLDIEIESRSHPRGGTLKNADFSAGKPRVLWRQASSLSARQKRREFLKSYIYIFSPKKWAGFIPKDPWDDCTSSHENPSMPSTIDVGIPGNHGSVLGT